MERRLRPPFFLCGKTWTISGWHTKTPSQGLRRYMEASKNSISSPPFLRQLLSCVAVRLFQRFIRRFECTTTIRQRRSEEHTSELQSHSDLVCRLLLEK